MTSLPEVWPEGVDVLLLPEDYTRGADEVTDEALGGRSVYPIDQLDIAKLLRAEGFRVEHLDSAEKRAHLTRKSDDFWLGVLAFTYGALQSGAGDLLADLVRRYVGPHRFSRTRIHGRIVSVETDTLSYREIEFNGLPGDEWLETLNRFLEDDTN